MKAPKKNKSSKQKLNTEKKPKHSKPKYDVGVVIVLLLNMILVFALTFPLGGGNDLYAIYINGTKVTVSDTAQLEQELAIRLPQNIFLEFTDNNGVVLQTVATPFKEIKATYLPDSLNKEVESFMRMDASTILQNKINFDVDELLKNFFGGEGQSKVFLFMPEAIDVNEEASMEYAQKKLNEFIAAEGAELENKEFFTSPETAAELSKTIIASMKSGNEKPIMISANGTIAIQE